MSKNNRKENDGKMVTALLSAVAGAAIAGLISYQVTKYAVEKEAAISLSFAKEQFTARAEEYPKLWKILRPLSKRSSAQFTPQLCQLISEELNQWLYDRGGLVAHQNTRSLVYRLREFCATWKAPPDWNPIERPKEASELKDNIIYACRSDLYLVSRDDLNIEALRELLEKRNREIAELQERIKPH